MAGTADPAGTADSAGTSAAAVRLAGVTIRRGGRPVVDRLTAEVPAGSLVGVVGPSGSGKTTLLRALVGVQRRVEGVVEVLGLPAGMPALRHQVGYLTQTPSVYSDITVRANLRYFAAIVGADAGDVDRVLDVVGMSGFADRRVERLSGGQRARVALASVLLGRPRLLVLDEPTVGLDPVLREELWASFRALASDGATLLVSTHVMDEAARCDSVLLLREGALLTHESPGSLLARTGAANLDEAFLRLVQAA